MISSAWNPQIIPAPGPGGHPIHHLCAGQFIKQHESKAGSVQSALSELMDLEKDRLEREDAARRRREEDERRRMEAEEAMRLASERARQRADEEARLARVRAEQQDLERRQRERDLAEMAVRKKIEIEGRLEEEELRMRHEEQLRNIEAAARKGFPAWGYAAMAGVLIAILLGSGLYSRHVVKKSEAEKQRMAEEAAAERQRLEEEKARRDEQIVALGGMLKDLEAKKILTEEELEKKKLLEAKIAGLVDSQPAQPQGKKKKNGGKKDGKTGDGKPRCDPLEDPLCQD